MIENNKLIKFSVSRKEEILQRKNNVICKDSEELEEIIRRSFNQKDENQNIYIGILPQECINKISQTLSNIRKDKIKDVINCDKEYALIIRQSDIRHIKKGSMTIDDCVNYILIAPEVVKNFDAVSFYRCQEKNALRFKKNINGNTYIVFLIVSNKKMIFTILTTFLEKNDYKKKKKPYLQTLLKQDYKSQPQRTRPKRMGYRFLL